MKLGGRGEVGGLKGRGVTGEQVLGVAWSKCLVFWRVGVGPRPCCRRHCRGRSTVCLHVRRLHAVTSLTSPFWVLLMCC